MKKLQVFQKGVQTDGQMWFRVGMTEGAFNLTGFIRTNDKELYDNTEEGAELDVPGTVVKAIKWQS